MANPRRAGGAMPVFYPLGYPVAIASSSEDAVAAAAESWAPWPPLFDAQPLEVRIEVVDGLSASVPRFRADAGGFEFEDGMLNRAEFREGSHQALLRVTRAALSSREWFRYHYLEALTLTALDSIAFTSIHAACVAREGRGLLLCGDSGAGKSSLAYACARHGWTFISDDSSRVVSGDGGRIVGDPWRLDLRPAAGALFPEIARRPRVLRPNGKTAVPMPVQGSATATAAGCVFLSRAAGRCGLRVFDAADARRYFRKYVWWGDTHRRNRDFDTVLRSGCYALEYDSIEDALELLEEVPCGAGWSRSDNLRAGCQPARNCTASHAERPPS